MVLFDNNIPVFHPRVGVIVGRYYQRRVYVNNTLSVHSCKRRARTRMRMRKVQKQANVHSTSTVIYSPRFFFVPRAIHVDFRVFLDVTQHS